MSNGSDSSILEQLLMEQMYIMYDNSVDNCVYVSAAAVVVYDTGLFAMCELVVLNYILTCDYSH